MSFSSAKPIRPIWIGIVFLLLMAACGGKQQTKGITDDHGRTVAVPETPQRVVSLSPAVTEIVFALGAQEMLVGRTDFCVYPPEAQNIPSIGGISDLNIERLLELDPDLIISGSMVSKKITDQLDKMHKSIVCVVGENRFDNLYVNIEKIGRLIGKEHEADSLVKNLKWKVENNLSEAASSQDGTTGRRPTVYYVVGFGAGGNYTAGGNTFINDIIRMAGARNIAEEIEGWNYSMEALVKEDPDYIIVRREDSAAFCSMAPYNRLNAVRNGHVIGIESSTIDLQVPRNIDAVLYLRHRMQTDL